MTAMNKSKKPKFKNDPVPIDEKSEFKVQGEVISDYQEIKKVGSPKKQLPKELEEYKWKPGQTGNPKGRSPDLVKSIAKRIAQLKAGKILSPKELQKLKKLGIADADITVIESIIVDWATSTNPIKQQMYIERLAGKVPNININAEISTALVSRFRSKFTDAELERIASGEDALEVLVDKLPDADTISGDDEVVDAENG